MNLPKLNISPKVYLIASIFIIIAISTYLISTSYYRSVKKIRVEIVNEHDNYFIDEKEILRLITLDDTDPIVGKYLRQIDLKEIEKRAKTCPYIQDVQAFKNHSGVLKIEVKQVKPLARIYYNGQNDKYLLPDGKLIAVSSRYTSRVVVVRGDYTYKFSNPEFTYSREWENYVTLFNTINQDAKWKAQIAEIKIEKSGSVIMYPQVGDYEISFGKPENLHEKFRKMDVFFKKILPMQGWNAYHAVNVQYKDQIVCD